MHLTTCFLGYTQENYQKSKFQFSWKGTFIIHGFGYYPTYWLRDPNGNIQKSLVNQINLAPWTARLEENESYFFEPSDQDLDPLEGEYRDDDDDRTFPEGGDDVAVRWFGSRSGGWLRLWIW